MQKDLGAKNNFIFSQVIDNFCRNGNHRQTSTCCNSDRTQSAKEEELKFFLMKSTGFTKLKENRKINSIVGLFA